MNYIIYLFIFLLLYSNSIKCSNLFIDLNNTLNELFKNPFSRLLLLLFVVYIGKKNIVYSIFVSVIFVLIMNKNNEKDIKESFKQIEGYKNI